MGRRINSRILPLARLRLEDERRQLGAPGVLLHDPGRHSALQAGGLRALPQRRRRTVMVFAGTFGDLGLTLKMVPK